MKVDYYAAVSYDGEVCCVRCLPSTLTVESAGVHPVFASEEFDGYPSCCVCGEVHDYVQLTDYGTVLEAAHLAGLNYMDAQKLASAGTVNRLGRELVTLARYVLEHGGC